MSEFRFAVVIINAEPFVVINVINAYAFPIMTSRNVCCEKGPHSVFLLAPVTVAPFCFVEKCNHSVFSFSGSLVTSTKPVFNI